MAEVDDIEVVDISYFTQQHYSDAAVAALQSAQVEASSRGLRELTTPLLLMGLMSNLNSAAAEIVRDLGESPERLWRATRLLEGSTRGAEGPSNSAQVQLRLGPNVKQVLRLAVDESRRLYASRYYVGTEHLLLGVIRLDLPDIREILGQAGITLERVRRVASDVPGPPLC